MSKKKKSTSAASAANPVVRPQTPPVVSSQRSESPKPLDGEETEQSSPLIRFDKRVKWTLGIFAGLFLLMVLLKWHYVSVPIWNRLLPDGSPETRGLIAGKPRQIRMDDYAVATPWVMSNANNGYPDENEAIGGLKSALLITVAKHPVAFFKFSEWGYLIFDLERGYSWGFLSGPLILLVGSFLFFLLVSRNQFWLSITGTLALLLSSGTVSWSFIPSSMIGYCCGAFVAVAYLLQSTKRSTILLASGLLIWIAVSYALSLYPPYQVPLAYLFALLLVGYFLNERARILPLQAVPFKLIGLVGATALAGIIVYLFKEDVQETVKAVTGTVYPGKRSEVGGTGFIANWYSEYYSWLFSDAKFPKNWLNTCEMAHYLNFAPTIIPFSIALFYVTKRIDWMVVMAAVFVLLMLIWIEVGFPKDLATISLMSMSPTRRTQIPMGIGGIILLFLYLGSLKNVKVQTPGWITTACVLATVIFVVYTAYININDSDGLIKSYQTFLPVVFFIGMNILLVFSLNIPQRIPIFCAGILLFLLPNLKVNPLSVGLSPITENQLYKTVRAIVEKDPEARWLVNGNQYITYMITATGAKQITGVKFIPDRQHIFSVLDPQMKRDSAYNRYAHVTNQSYINGRDTVVLVNQFEDAYVIAMDPCSPRMKKLNVKYQLFDHQPQPVEVRCMSSVATLGSLTIYQANP
ncbi:hypothetical protein [Spirosoma sp. KNUC1025]|uniref:DUF7657 domain-containing protein n=1 Tax=Spirosoma sp. KNUC1025 TaxID=2894082 RepID=UPI00386AFA98|nr:hypothetical protein LN737_04775 [Spirosoma sp. KNUC1025]